MDLDLPFTLDPSLAGPPSPPAGPGQLPGPSTDVHPPSPRNGPPHPVPPTDPVPPAHPSNGNVVPHRTDPTELNLGRFGPLQGPKSSKIHVAGPDATGVPAVPAQPAGRGESPWALPPQRLSVGAEESGRDEESGRGRAPDGAERTGGAEGAGGTGALGRAGESGRAGQPGEVAESSGVDEGVPGAAVGVGAVGHPSTAEPGTVSSGPQPPSEHPSAAGVPAVPPLPAPAAPPPLPPPPLLPPPLLTEPGPTGWPGPISGSDPDHPGPPGAGPADPGSVRPGSIGPEGPVPPRQQPPGQQPPGGWYRSSWPEQPGPAGMPPAAYPDPATPAGYPELGWSPESGIAPTAEDFARRRQIRPADPIATMGVRAVVNRIGLVKLPPGQHEQEVKRDIEMVRRNFGGLRQVTVVNPKGGAGKTVAILLLAMTFGQKRGGYVLAWDNNETQGTLGMRAQQDFHSRTVRDMLRDLGQFQGPHGRIGDLSQYVRSQGEGMFDVLASDESATGGEMLTAAAFAEIREVVSRFYKLIFVDTGNNVRAQNWQAAMDATDQLVVTMSARNDSAETAARMLDHLEQSGRHRLVRQAVTVVSMPPSRKEIDLPAIQEHFAARTRAVLLAPYERLIDTGEPIRYGGLSSASRDAWLKIAAAVAEGL
ncbi:chromosome partitioning protein [Micromonospora matsumotoense]